MNKKIKIAINGFGRIGRLFFRQAMEEPQFDIVAINDLGDVENLAYLLKYDSVYRAFLGEISVKKTSDKNYLIVNAREILFLREKEPEKLPWKDLSVDIVVESTGVFETFEKAKAHLNAGAKKAVLTAPAKDSDSELGQTVLMGINDSKLKICKISSNASCTTNSVSPVMAVLSENPGIIKAVLNTVHAYTNTQTIVDSPVKGNDFRRGRAGAQNIIPSTTGAAIAVTRVIKELEGKFDGIAVRVPVVSGSIADITFVSKRKTSVEEINKILREAADSPRWQGILKVIDEQVVSSDIIGEPFGAIVDLKFTKVIDGDLVKVLSWYDNEWGYAATLVKHILKAGENL
ncbi:MAG: Glyceraldehyde 3-phosphate dehydrogenase [Candidatus Wolfebacteria bacterium GW2011_GWA2_42_10]|uniref:Glyceraldehyde 3-phosphate dehydrogenase n=2 Tax=Candidatus Wolfeibacteriota TaxID=1752735 RepID=A0A0G0XKP0_9BACT|nr:MAG: Glyceraldehyde 3-phosphate dehydrogenase [Candidatus Wolfebacteria bacterium GW2011_GWB1_41_12]KKS25469.1 MAG: Glyceraldehyde 3-phosphate dehydrogenase [Candidatus Wolfebacteria bacterium GW2011_GWA2_42_10]KKT56646.1 MAG: Glyceraldehyde 3-phosphate dehydrogenase [Candidatus Wolfebacteria bacterium GW2011_GWA1_44_24]